MDNSLDRQISDSQPIGALKKPNAFPKKEGIFFMLHIFLKINIIINDSQPCLKTRHWLYCFHNKSIKLYATFKTCHYYKQRKCL